MNVPLRKNMQLIDANVILRFVLNDNVEMAQRAAEVIALGVYTKPEIIAEVVYVLKSVYSTPKDKIKSIIHGLSDIVRIENSDCVVHAIDLFSMDLSFLFRPLRTA